MATIAEHDPALHSLVVHDLRHVAASLAISSGGNIKAVQRMPGHAKTSTTLDIYGHLYVEDLERLAVSMNERIRRIA